MSNLAMPKVDRKLISRKADIIADIKKSNSISIHLRNKKFLSDENHKNLELVQ